MEWEATQKIDKQLLLLKQPFSDGYIHRTQLFLLASLEYICFDHKVVLKAVQIVM